jgi:FHS family L-fucose permease-like MFS transporter
MDFYKIFLSAHKGFGYLELVLVALFIIACGLTILETAANPYAALLGDPKTSVQRLNLAQSFNGLAAALAPVIGGYLIFTKGKTEAELNLMSESARKIALASEASTVKTPYIILGIVLILIAVIFGFTKLPKIEIEGNKASSKSVFHALKHKHLSWAVVAQFFYVGAQVSVFSLFILYATKAATIDEQTAAIYLSTCGFAFLIGRFLGTFLMRFISPASLLAMYALINVLLCIIAMLGTGMITIYAIVGICFFMSIMFPTIFALGIEGAGAETKPASSLLIMSIVGGAIIPPIASKITDISGNIHFSYIVPLVCFIIVFLFSLRFRNKKISS